MGWGCGSVKGDCLEHESLGSMYNNHNITNQTNKTQEDKNIH